MRVILLMIVACSTSYASELVTGLGAWQIYENLMVSEKFSAQSGRYYKSVGGLSCIAQLNGELYSFQCDLKPGNAGHADLWNALRTPTSRENSSNPNVRIYTKTLGALKCRAVIGPSGSEFNCQL